MSQSKKKTVKRRVVVRRKQSAYVPPKLPEKPPVEGGAKSYGRTKRGAYIVPRFLVTQHYPYGNTPWYVLDLAEGTIASGTEKKGYPKKKAVTIARSYRDKYGAWATMPF